ncbi:sulfurtransferase TusA family protein [Chelatococcus sambhunathii]|uniref:Sulfurtransferase TusA family protein n=1 Tax=Chelatococcus sambhunathii TaxID=363953 RepID=A0ABU1DB15_9HYPH|nr:sulfurtransferase TusA family protein [Chelatococcus sambhunathii]MDR4305307.1 sulfurtransferase TusA family protein [Chelatococcus sambhunathii]
MKSLDLRGLRCPLPVLKTRKALGALEAGESIEVTSDDPLAAVDIPNLLRESGDELVATQPTERSGVRFVIRKGRRDPFAVSRREDA